MSDENKKEGFSYTYSAKECEEIKRIRQKYTPRETGVSKIDELRRLDASVNQRATCVSLIFGIMGALLLGTGMSFTMTELVGLFGSTVLAMIIGISLGIAGILLMIFAYPVYMRVTKKQREKIAPDIIRITDELIK